MTEGKSKTSYQRWQSPISLSDVFATASAPSYLQVEGQRLFWMEQNASKGGITELKYCDVSANGTAVERMLLRAISPTFVMIKINESIRHWLAMIQIRLLRSHQTSKPKVCLKACSQTCAFLKMGNGFLL